MTPLRRYSLNQSGSAAAEFGLLLPALLILAFGIFHLCYAVYAASNLHWAVEQSARCAAMSQQNTGLSCGTGQSETTTYAQGLYSGPKLNSLTFASADDTADGCRKVSGSGSYHIPLGFLSVDVPMSAKACYPVAPSPTWAAS